MISITLTKTGSRGVGCFILKFTSEFLEHSNINFRSVSVLVFFQLEQDNDGENRKYFFIFSS